GAAERHRRFASDARGAEGAAARRAAGARAVTLWGGRVGASLAPEVWAFLRVQDDGLLPYDVEGTLIHARRLEAAGFLTAHELHDVEERLAAVSIDALDARDEDVHSAIERLLGRVGLKVHA